MLVAKEKAIARPAIKNAPKDITIVCALDRYQYCGAPSQISDVPMQNPLGIAKGSIRYIIPEEWNKL